MPSTYSSNLKLELIASGEQSGTWGTTTNVNLGTALEEAISGIASVAMTDADTTLTALNANTTQAFRHLILNVTGALTATRNVVVPTIEKQYIVWNNTTGSQDIVIKTAAGTGVTVPNGAKMHVIADGTNVVEAVDQLVGLTATASELNILDGATLSTAELNILDGVTATTSELNILDGVTASFSEINILDGATLSTAELNILDGVTASTAELNILDGLTATTAELNYLDVTTLGTSEASKAVTTDANGVTVFAGGVVEDETSVTSSSNTTTINCQDGNVFTHTLTEDTTFSFTNPPASGLAFGFTLKVVQDSTARTITWPASVDWPSATAPTLSAGSGDVDVFVFFTHDNGTTWYGFIAGQVMS